ncbi:SPOR domain-containing protein, partial [Hyphomicrobium sp.]|uniref:SPOR domain-containing protein n=1 Tax=Hyphomicrobium sp. TaxID=82 RepID=UPI0025C5EED2
MSSQNAFPGRQPARSATPTGNASQPSWVNPQAQAPTGRPQQQNTWPPQQPVQGYPNFQDPAGAGGRAADPQQASYGQWSDQQAGQRGSYGGYPQSGTSQPDPYAPQFEPYVPPSRPNYTQPQQQSPGFAQPQAPAFGGQQGQHPAQQWPGRNDQRGYEPAGYGAQGFGTQQAAPAGATFGQQQYHDTELSSNDWAGPHDNFGDHYQQHGDPHLGFGQPEGGELEPVYNDEDVEYEDEEDAPRGRRPLMIVAALIGAIVIGGGMAYGYKKFSGGGSPTGEPPVVKSDDFAARTKPADAGGKQFPYSDTKIMGRLGDGTSSASAEDANAPPQPSSPDNSGDSSNTSTDDGGARKVSTLVVGRDGTIMPPATPTQDQAPVQQPQSGGTGVPGTSLVDVFGQQQGGGGAPASHDSQPVMPKPLNAEEAPAKKVK